MSSEARINIDEWDYLGDESGGVLAKTWVSDPDGGVWLYKEVRTHKNGSISTSDFSEVMVYRIAEFLDLPAAEYHLASRHGRHGAISRDLRMDGYELDEGWKWLRSHPRKPLVSMQRKTADSPPKKVSDYSRENLKDCFKELAVPEGVQGSRDSFTQFCGYLLLDALVANTDRHEANWGIYRPPEGQSHFQLAPTFDHGAAFGQQLTGAQKHQILSTPNKLEKWCKQGIAKRFAPEATGEKLTLVKYFVEASRMADDQHSVNNWLRMVESLGVPNMLERLFSDLTRLSEVTVKFAVEVVRENWRRILNEF